MKTRVLRIAMPAMVLLSLVTVMTGCSESYGHRVVSAGESELTISDQEGMEQQTHEVAADAKITLDGQPVELGQLVAGDAVHVTTEEREGKKVATEIKAKAKETLKAEEQLEETAPTFPDEQPIQPLGDMPLPLSEEAPQADFAPPAIVPDVDAPLINPEVGAPSNEVDDQPAEEMFKGTISSINTVDNQLVVTDENGDEHTFSVNDDTTFLLDGEEATFGDLMVDHRVEVSAEREGDSLIAKSIDATTE